VRAQEHVTNVLLAAGADERAAEYALPAIAQWLRWRAEQLRAEGLYGDAAWFARVANEVSLADDPPGEPGSGGDGEGVGRVLNVGGQAGGDGTPAEEQDVA
jgi:hypothetical protein